MTVFLLSLCIKLTQNQFYVQITNQNPNIKTKNIQKSQPIKNHCKALMQYQQQSIDSVRFIYNTTPRTKIQLAKSYIHPAFHYTPLEVPNITQIDYNPLTCGCEAVFSKFCPVDYNAKTIKCCICGMVTAMPANYAKNIKPGHLPHQLMPQNTTLEFKGATVKKEHRQSYLFVVDLCILEKELKAVKEALIDVINQLPDWTNVGLITYNQFVNVYELSSKLNMIYCINGEKEYTLEQSMNILGIQVKMDTQLGNSQIPRRFIVPVSQFRDKIVRRINDLKVDPIIYVNERNKAALGQALNVAISLCEANIHTTRICMLVGSPCTHGPGKVIESSFKCQIRSPQEVANGQNVTLFNSAKKFYDALSKRVIPKKIIIDLFAFTLNEMGLAEMIELLNNSGGFIVMHEEFSDRIFKESFPKIFLRKETIEKQQNQQEGESQEIDLNIMSECSMSIYCSKEVVINGALGHCVSLNKGKTFVSDKVIGKGKTHAWYLGSLDTNRTITFVYDLKEAEAKEPNYYIQIKTHYKNRSGEYITRVTTVQKQWSDRLEAIAEGFDEQAAAVYLARMCVNKALFEEQKNIRQWLDQSLCKWAQHYSNFIKNDQSSFSLPHTMKRLPQLVYHLRRSRFVNRFGISLDESYYIGYILDRESVLNCISMIQPALLKYSLQNNEPSPVSLDEEEMQDEVILLLDSYFNVIEWYGAHCQNWLEENYHENSDYAHIADLFDSPKQDINYIMASRFPVPNFYRVHPGHSKERYLKSRVNPKKEVENENTITDDSDLKGFMHHLIKVVVRQA